MTDYLSEIGKSRIQVKIYSVKISKYCRLKLISRPYVLLFKQLSASSTFTLPFLHLQFKQPF